MQTYAEGPPHKDTGRRRPPTSQGERPQGKPTLWQLDLRSLASGTVGKHGSAV